MSQPPEGGPRKTRPYTPAEEKIGSVAVRVMSVLNTWVYRASGGRVGGRFLRGAPVCLLTTTGRKSGRPRVAPLLYLEDGENVVVVASKGGMSQHPLWYRNLESNPEALLQIGSHTTKRRARPASPDEKRRLWPKLVAMYPDYDDYQARTEREIPVVILVPS